MRSESPIENTADWPMVSLDQITTKIGSGATPRGGSETYLATRSRFALVRSQNVYDRHFDRDGLAFITDDQANGLGNAQLQPGDVLLNITGDGITFGRSCMVPSDVHPACVNQHVSILRVDPRLADPGYLLAFLTHPNVKPYIESFNAGGSRRAITKSHIESFRLPLPLLDEQRAIAHILGALDDKIDLNRRMNETLEETARALFKSWFVDFDPVRAKAEGRHPLGVDAKTAALFPEKLDGSEVGEVPKGWCVTSIGDWASLVRGTTYKSALLGGDGPYLLGLASIRRDGGFRADSLRRYGGESPERLLLRRGDLFVSLKDVTQSGDLLGSVARVPAWIKEGRLTQDTVRLDISGQYADERRTFLYPMLRTPAYREYCRARAMGTTNLSMSREDFLAYPFVAPSPDVLRRLVEPLTSMTARAEDISESAALATLRDYLLPKLLSGEVRVRDAEKLVEAAT